MTKLMTVTKRHHTFQSSSLPNLHRACLCGRGVVIIAHSLISSILLFCICDFVWSFHIGRNESVAERVICHSVFLVF